MLCTYTLRWVSACQEGHLSFCHLLLKVVYGEHVGRITEENSLNHLPNPSRLLAFSKGMYAVKLL